MKTLRKPHNARRHPKHTFDAQLLNAGIFYLSKGQELSVQNDMASDLLGVPRGTNQAFPLSEAFDVNSEEYQFMVHVVENEYEYRDAILKWEVGGLVRHVLVDTFHDEDEDGAGGMYIVMKDMGNFALLNQNTQRAERIATVGRLAAGIAHEIRNPLTTVKGFLQLLEQRLNSGMMDEEIRYVQVMMGEIERVNALVTELLLLSKPQDMEWSTFDLQGLFSEILPWAEAVADDAGIQAECRIADGVALQADRNMIRQLLLHLVKNAIEAMDKGGKLRIDAREIDGRVEIEVADTGPGIPYYLFDRIFDVFYTTKEKGTGLGLAICQRIVADHGGQIRVSSKGFGTTFTVSLPLKRASSLHHLAVRRSC
ncbi:two-component system sensor histidine kinase NtrB [Alicyclobacillus sacchari]|uniref:two-component system sensor histidine kinase NtrB n=1 Tax=Alicyclobacillus sacchari TaxID=392010 RepID=UPI001FB8DC6F|nr:ATP-binding protein [Alicyclobacillus sacchari]